MSIEKRKKRAKEILRILKKLFPRTKVALINWKNPWELLVATILSAQTTDKKVNEVTTRLFKKYKKLDDYVNATQEEFEQDVKEIGLYRNKTKNILASAKLVKEKFGGKVPNTMEEILELPGVARKTGNIVLHNAYGIVEGIAVDTHVMRLSQRLGLSAHKNPVKIERDLMELLPKKEWPELNYRLVDYGRTYCAAKPHAHDKCPLNKFGA
ncbi:MAG: endonuclease III [Candidatus Colwellbacteria bacterium]|nr:endonuclease III [Candidatus Colwellbacteria bacterium]